jgi:hypothetical protein
LSVAVVDPLDELEFELQAASPAAAVPARANRMKPRRPTIRSGLWPGFCSW